MKKVFKSDPMVDLHIPLSDLLLITLTIGDSSTYSREGSLCRFKDKINGYFSDPYDEEVVNALQILGQENNTCTQIFHYLRKKLQEEAHVYAEDYVDPDRPEKVYVNYYFTKEGEIIRGTWAFKDPVVALRCSKEADSHPIGISTEKYDPSLHKFKGD